MKDGIVTFLLHKKVHISVTINCSRSQLNKQAPSHSLFGGLYLNLITIVQKVSVQ
jgi:hypothetical protein